MGEYRLFLIYRFDKMNDSIIWSESIESNIFFKCNSSPSFSRYYISQVIFNYFELKEATGIFNKKRKKIFILETTQTFFFEKKCFYELLYLGTLHLNNTLTFDIIQKLQYRMNLYNTNNFANSSNFSSKRYHSFFGFSSVL